MTVNAADYYRSLDDADEFFDNQLFATDWSGASDADKEKALLAAARAIESLRFKGEKTPVFNVIYNSDGTLKAPSPTQAEIEAADATQAKKWPRDGVDFSATVTGDTVQTLFVYATPGTTGNVTITVTIDGTAYTTADVAFDAVAAAIQTAIDTALATVPNYTAGDVVVAGGPLTTTAVTLTFSGASVAATAHSTRPVVTSSTGFDGTLSSPSGSATVSGECPDRVFFAQCEEAVSLLSGRDPRIEFENSRLSSDGVGSSRVSVDTTTGQQHTAHMFTSALAWKYLLGFLNPDNNSFEVQRT